MQNTDAERQLDQAEARIHDCRLMRDDPHCFIDRRREDHGPHKTKAMEWDEHDAQANGIGLEAGE